MDWTPYMSGFFALGGTILAGLFLLRSQRIAQRNENARALRKAAYEAAMLEWKTRLENDYWEPWGEPLLISDFVSLHIAHISVIAGLDPSDQAEQVKIKALLAPLEAELALRHKHNDAPDKKTGQGEKP